MAKTKISIKEKRRIIRAFSLGCSLVAFILMFFELSLIFHGDLDDVNYTMVFATPLISATGMLFAIVNIIKFRARTHELVASLSMVAISALFFCYAMLYASTVYLAST